MEYIIGVGLALFVCGAAAWLGMGFCLAFDVTAAVFVGCRLARRARLNGPASAAGDSFRALESSGR